MLSQNATRESGIVTNSCFKIAPALPALILPLISGTSLFYLLPLLISFTKSRRDVFVEHHVLELLNVIQQLVMCGTARLSLIKAKQHSLLFLTHLILLSDGCELQYADTYYAFELRPHCQAAYVCWCRYGCSARLFVPKQSFSSTKLQAIHEKDGNGYGLVYHSDNSVHILMMIFHCY